MHLPIRPQPWTSLSLDKSTLDDPSFEFVVKIDSMQFRAKGAMCPYDTNLFDPVQTALSVKIELHKTIHGIRWKTVAGSAGVTQ